MQVFKSAWDLREDHEAILVPGFTPNMEDDSVLCHPEILPAEKLIEILSSRGIPEKELRDQNKDILVQLCHRYIVPLPQRITNMRRGNRLRKKLNPMRLDDSLETPDEERVLKRKQPLHGIDEAIKATQVPDVLCQTKLCSPMTECTKEINGLTVNCVAKTPPKPIKINRNFLSKEQQLKSDSHLQQQNNVNLCKNTPRAEAATQETKQESSSSETQIDSEDEKKNKAKKFKRMTVTWP